jgi:aspartyl/asparaginyl-tRNA synthetase
MKIDNYKLSQYINTMRNYFIKRNFFEIHLYSTVQYVIKNTDYFTLKKWLFLRVNPEPEIWEYGEKYENFFWIWSLFRNEKKLSSKHLYEFTVIDIYQKGWKELVKKTFFDLLVFLEETLWLSKISKTIIEVDYNVVLENLELKEGWILVNNYPVNESFYDIDNGDWTTKKFELFYKKWKSILEITACWELWQNTNKNNYIEKADFTLKTWPLNCWLVWFGIWIERLISLYEKTS